MYSTCVKVRLTIFATTGSISGQSIPELQFRTVHRELRVLSVQEASSAATFSAHHGLSKLLQRIKSIASKVRTALSIV
jgi:hypothetical protein